MSHPVRRHVVEIDGRAVHLRILGQGPAALLLHESPRSSVAVLPLAQALAERFTVFCPDTPGYGLSDPLRLARPEIEDFGDAAAALIDALGLARPALYGTHTGAEIALAAALRHPGKVGRVALDGFPVFTTQEKEEQLRHYLPRFAPEWSGAHMAALWARVRDQFQFYPWYAAGEANWLTHDPRPLEFHDQVIADLFAAGVADAPNYATGYAAAFRFDGAGAVRQAAEAGLDVTYLCREDDLLFPHLDRIAALAPGAALKRLTPDRDAWAAAQAEALAMPDAPDAPPPPAQSRRLYFSDQGLLMRRHGPETGAATLLLHAHPGSGALFARRAERAARGMGPLFAPDLPGSGESAALGGDPETLAARMAVALAEALPAGVSEDKPVAIEAWFTSIRVAEALAARDPGRFSVSARHDPLPQGAALERLRAAYIQEMPSDWHGSHMMAAWWRARDAVAYDPWFDRRVASRRRLPEEVDLAMLSAHAVAILQGRRTESEVIRALLA